MKISFKSKFILSFFTIGVIFISLIVFFNFSSLNKLSKSLIEEKIETSGKLFIELVKTPLVVYDLATIDNALESFISIKNVASVEVLDNHNRIISHKNNKFYNYENIFKNNDTEVEVDNRVFRLSTLPIVLDGEVLGSAKIIFELTDSLKTIKENRNLTFLLVLFEIVVSIIIAYVIGHRLTGALSLLTASAEKIAQDDQIIIPELKSNGDEISVLSDALHIMQHRIAERNANIRKDRDFYTALLDHANSIILVMNAKGEIVLSNKIVEKLTGYTQKELEGKIPWKIFIPKEQQENIEKVFFSLVAGNFPNSYENVWIVKDGSHVPFAWSNSCIVDENGDIEYVITVGVDMTERNRIDQTMRALLNSPLDSILLISIDETIIEINEIAADRLDSVAEELIGRKINEFVSEDIKRIRRRYINRIISTKKPITFEEAYNGSIFKNHLYPIVDNNGDVMQISIFSHDVTAHRKAQKELQKYIKLVDENVLISHTDLKGVTTSVSQAFCKISGYSSEELIGNNYRSLRDPSTDASLYEGLWKTIKRGDVWRGEVRNRAKDGHFFWIEMSIYPDYNDDGDIVGYNAIRQDITNKKLLEELSITDQLTSLYNRRQFDAVFEAEMNRARRDEKIFCLMSLDVDNFKMYNDTYGHHMGDDVLIAIAKVMKRHVQRSGDFAFRLGGEEFAVIYTATDKEHAFEFANIICKAIENEKIEHKKNTASDYVTASIGVVFVDFENNKVITDKKLLYESADILLYKAKNSGRNRVEIDEFV